MILINWIFIKNIAYSFVPLEKPDFRYPFCYSNYKNLLTIYFSHLHRAIASTLLFSLNFFSVFIYSTQYIKFDINLPIFIFNIFICICWIILLISNFNCILCLRYLIGILIDFLINIIKFILSCRFILFFKEFFQRLRISSMYFLYSKILFYFFIRYFNRIIKIILF